MTDPDIRPIAKEDEPAVAAVIRAVMPEFGACGPGFALSDPELDFMHEAYSKPRHAYFVARADGMVLGGAGLGPLAGGDGSVCELRKMYLLPEARGRGLGRRLLQLCLKRAKELGFSSCYLETLSGMDAARALYERSGFSPLCAPLGKTGHFGCDRWYSRPL